MKETITIPITHRWLGESGDGGKCSVCKGPRLGTQFRVIVTAGQSPPQRLKFCICRACWNANKP